MSEEMAVKEIGDRSDEPCMNGEPTPETAPGVADDPPGAEADNEASMTSQPSVSDDTKSDPGSSATDSVSGAAEATVNDASAPVDATDFKGFELTEADNALLDYRRVLERLEEELACDVATLTPVRRVSAVANRRARRDRDPDGSRPSSALSVRSDGSALGSDAVSAPSSPAGSGRRRPNSEWASPLLRAPLEQGWRRELVYRATLDHHSRRNADIYYYTPAGKKLRSTREIAENLSGTGFTLENFSFFKEPLGIDDPEKEIIRDAKVIRRLESPLSPALAAAAAPVEGKRTPKPKVPKGASPPPSPALVAASDKIKVKSLGSRLSRSGSGGGGGAPAGGPRAEKRSAASDNNNTTPWKKASEERRRGGGTGAGTGAGAGGASAAAHTANGAASPPAGAKRRGRPRLDDGDRFTSFYETSKRRGYDVAVQILQYVGMRELAQCARVSRLWRQLASAPALWRHVRMKNSQVNDWAGLCGALRRHGTRRLDLRKMLLPSNDADFWRQFAQHIASVDTLERIELCRCPSSAVEAVCRGIPGLRALCATAVRDTRLDPTPLGGLTELRDLRLKSMAGLTLTSDLWPLVRLQHLQHLSLTSIKELGACACEVVGELSGLLSLELGECTFGAEFGATLSRLRRLQRLRLERGTADGAAPALLRTLARMPDLRQLELVNFDVKVGFDEALAECRNVQRLLIIPTYVSQSATTNKQVLSGVLRLRDSLTHLMWGVTIELLRVTELFIDQCEQGVDRRRADVGECIPVLKPVPGYRLGEEARTAGAGPPQVEILPLSALQRLLSAELPGTRLKLLRIPFHATWRQSLADFQ